MCTLLKGFAGCAGSKIDLILKEREGWMAPRTAAVRLSEVAERGLAWASGSALLLPRHITQVRYPPPSLCLPMWTTFLTKGVCVWDSADRLHHVWALYNVWSCFWGHGGSLKPAHDSGFDSHCLQRRHPEADNGAFKQPNLASAPLHCIRTGGERRDSRLHCLKGSCHWNYVSL